MRILKVHNYYLQSGGEDSVFVAERDLLRSNGHEVIEYLEFNTKIASMNKALFAVQTLWSQTAYQKLKQYLQKNKPDVVHFHNIFPLFSPSVYYACKENNIPVIQTLDNQRLICPAASFYRNGKLCLDCLGKNIPLPSIVHACYHNSYIHSAVVTSMLTLHQYLKTWKKMVDVFLCSTIFYKDLFVQAGLPSEKIIVMPHFTLPNKNLQNKKSKSGDYALFIGRLDPEKGVKTLLDGWQQSAIPLKIRGDGQLLDYTKNYIEQHNIKTIELVDKLSQEELSNLIQNARFLILASEGYYETFGMVIVEGYAHGIPVLASNIGVMTEMVVNQKTGMLFEAGNPQDLANKAQWMWTHPDETQAMGVNALTEYMQRFTPEKCYQTLTEIYTKAINRNG
jgi:glycosyltransferase involved in cell wall biosynthesis